jgi:hypothetical protein
MFLAITHNYQDIVLSTNGHETGSNELLHFKKRDTSVDPCKDVVQDFSMKKKSKREQTCITTLLVVALLQSLQSSRHRIMVSLC